MLALEAGVLRLVSLCLGFLIQKAHGPCSWHGNQELLFSLFKGPSATAGLQRAASWLCGFTWWGATRVSLPVAKWLCELAWALGAHPQCLLCRGRLPWTAVPASCSFTAAAATAIRPWASPRPGLLSPSCLPLAQSLSGAD